MRNSGRSVVSVEGVICLSASSPVIMCVVGVVCLGAGIFLLFIWRTLWRFLFGVGLVVVGAALTYVFLSGWLGLPALSELFLP